MFNQRKYPLCPLTAPIVFKWAHRLVGAAKIFVFTFRMQKIRSINSLQMHCIGHSKQYFWWKPKNEQMDFIIVRSLKNCIFWHFLLFNRMIFIVYVYSVAVPVTVAFASKLRRRKNHKGPTDMRSTDMLNYVPFPFYDEGFIYSIVRTRCTLSFFFFYLRWFSDHRISPKNKNDFRRCK